MTDYLRWLVAAEVLGIAVLPLTVFLFQRLPDRGYAFSKLLGLLAASYLIWLVGSLFPVASFGPLPWLAALLIGVCCWAGRGKATVHRLRPTRRVILIEELLFLAVLLFWTLLRVYTAHSAIDHTEQFMDLAFLNASYHASSYPPYDPWMAGKTLNYYYYFSYLMMAVLGRLSGVPAASAYNLSLSYLYALLLTGAYSIGYVLTRSRVWAAAAPAAVGVVGNWWAAFGQVSQGRLPNNTHLWFFASTRVVEGPGDFTINEFPFFSYLLGDLHPHVIALPLTLLLVALGIAFLLDRDCGRPDHSTWLVVAAGVVLGSLLAANSWDYPTYLLLIGVFLGISAYRRGRGWLKRWTLTVAAVIGLSFLCYSPLFLDFKPATYGLGFVHTRSPLVPFLAVFGLFLIGGAFLLFSILRPADESGEVGSPRRSLRDRYTSSGRYAAALVLRSLATTGLLVVGSAALLAAAADSVLPLALDLSFAAAGVMVLRKLLAREESSPADIAAVSLLVVGCFILALTELVHIRDTFAGTPSYRMTTVFKLYYQAWTLLGLAAVYGAFRVLARRAPGWSVKRTAALAVLALGTGASLVYTLLAPWSIALSYPDPHDTGLSGMAWMQRALPGDYAAITWLQGHAAPTAVVLEAPSTQYNWLSRISTFSGRPTVIGWATHEEQLRRGQADIKRRVRDVNRIYRTHDPAVARHLLRRYRVQFVILGRPELALSHRDPAAAAKFKTFLHVAYTSRGTAILTWKSACTSPSGYACVSK